MCGLRLDARTVRYFFLNWGFRGRSSLLPRDAATRTDKLTLCGPHADRFLAMLERFQLANKRPPGRYDNGLDRDTLPVTHDS